MLQNRKHEGFIANEVLSKITKIKAFIHSSKFSSNYTYNYIVAHLVKLYIPNPKKQNELLKRQSNYRNVAFGHLHHGRLTVYFNPKTPGMPETYFTTSDSSYKLFYEIYTALPDLICSNLEYTIDLFCNNHVAVGQLFHTLRKNMYFSRGKSTNTIGGKLDGIDIERVTNAVYQINKESKSRYIKLYERGDDAKKKTFVRKAGNWKHTDCDRVRVEFTYKRTILKAKSPANLEQLISTPRIDQLLGDKENLRIIREISFKKFVPHKDLPYPWEYYPSPDKKGHADCFQEEFLQAKKRGIKNISQYIKDYNLFNGLQNKIEAAILDFNNNWGKI